MNKIQMKELLKLRNVTEIRPNYISIGDAIAKTGGNASVDEMVVVNERAMNYFANKSNESESEIQKNLDQLSRDIEYLEKRLKEQKAFTEWLYVYTHNKNHCFDSLSEFYELCRFECTTYKTKPSSIVRPKSELLVKK